MIVICHVKIQRSYEQLKSEKFYKKKCAMGVEALTLKHIFNLK